MDPKAAAKSKRSHTVHGRRAPQTPAAAAAHRQKRAAAVASSAPRRRNLPSNWDRYDAEGEVDESVVTAEWTGEVAARSKGAAAGGSHRQRCPSFYRPLLHRSTMSALWYVAAAHSAHPPNQVLAPDRAVGRSVCPGSVVFSQRRHHLCFVGVQMRRHPWAVLRRASPFPLFLSTPYVLHSPLIQLVPEMP